MRSSLATSRVFDDQAVFRAVMEAFASPGEIRKVVAVDAPQPLAAGSAAILQCLSDFETPLWLDETLRRPAVIDWIRFRTSAPIIEDKSAASLAVIAQPEEMPVFDAFSSGNPDYPDRSTTVVLQVGSMRAGSSFCLAGPGIRGTRLLRFEPVPPAFAHRWTIAREAFPCGIDLLLVAADEIVALPRSVAIAEGA